MAWSRSTRGSRYQRQRVPVPARRAMMPLNRMRLRARVRTARSGPERLFGRLEPRQGLVVAPEGRDGPGQPLGLFERHAPDVRDLGVDLDQDRLVR